MMEQKLPAQDEAAVSKSSVGATSPMSTKKKITYRSGNMMIPFSSNHPALVIVDFAFLSILISYVVAICLL